MKTQNRPWIVLKFPEQCENDLQCYRRVINDYWKSIDATDQDVLFDCGDVCFIRPLGGKGLALLIRGFLQQGSRKQSGVSSKSRGRNAGAGLDVLRGYLKHSGALEIISKDGRWRQKPDGTTLKETLPFSFPGTCINVEFDNRKILDWAYE